MSKELLAKKWRVEHIEYYPGASCLCTADAENLAEPEDGCMVTFETDVADHIAKVHNEWLERGEEQVDATTTDEP